MQRNVSQDHGHLQAQAGRVTYAVSPEDNLQNRVSKAHRWDCRRPVRHIFLSTERRPQAQGVRGPDFRHFEHTLDPQQGDRLGRSPCPYQSCHQGARGKGQLSKRLHNRTYWVVVRYVLNSMPLSVLVFIGTVASAVSGVLIACCEHSASLVCSHSRHVPCPEVGASGACCPTGNPSMSGARLST